MSVFIAIYGLLGFLSFRRFVWLANGKWTYMKETGFYSYDERSYGLARSIFASIPMAVAWPLTWFIMAVFKGLDAEEHTVTGQVRGIGERLLKAAGVAIVRGFKRLVISEPHHEKMKRKLRSAEDRLAELERAR